MRRKLIIWHILLLLIVSGCTQEPLSVNLLIGNQDQTVESLEPISPEPLVVVQKASRVQEVRLTAVGDVMVHKTQLVKADRGDHFDFEPAFRWIKTIIESSDYAIANLETNFAGPNGQRLIRLDQHYKSYSGYPVFNAPDILGKNLKDAGFDLLLNANNHTLDSKESGLLRTIEVMDQLGFDHIGTYANEEDALTPFIVEVKGIRFGIINYTYGMNGFNLAEEDGYMVNHLNNYEDTSIQKMNDQVRAMNKEDVDFVVVAIHYGIEYRTMPDRYVQQPIVDGLFAAGADIILGGHPHVLQPFEVRTLIREDGSAETGVVIYSLGNFVASQKYQYTNDDTDIGVIFELGFKQVDNQKPQINEIAIAPTYLYFSDQAVEVVPILAIPDAVVLSGYDQGRIEHAIKEVMPLMGHFTAIEPVIDGAFYRYFLKEVDE